MNENNIVSREEILKTLNELKVVLSKDGCTTKLKIMKKSIIEMPEKENVRNKLRHSLIECLFYFYKTLKEGDSPRKFFLIVRKHKQ